MPGKPLPSLDNMQASKSNAKSPIPAKIKFNLFIEHASKIDSLTYMKHNQIEARTLKLKTFDKVQGWQTLETFTDFQSAQKRAKAILESNPLWTANNLRIVDEP